MQNQQSMSVEKSAINAHEHLPDIVEEYKAISLKLFEFSDISDVTAEEQAKITIRETALLDRQSSLMETALSTPVTSIEDAKALLSLWHLDVVQSAMPGSLDASDELVAAAYHFISKT
ncbi:MAG: hypothetical protein EX271_10765 [Acidimicrobiales bacterium]|nr:hypothetical protein [Hyphomonadaceae bacterium]RZV39174.1 MAG: hypothetical protein EX271_10765 [Acidimicrobiales bacterium]